MPLHLPSAPVLLPALVTLGLAASPSARAVPPFGAESGTWHQLSYPADTAGRSLRTLFGHALEPLDYARTWQVYVFDARTQGYLDPGIDGTLAEGRGFWFIQATGTTVELGGADLPYATGTASSACRVIEGCRESSLSGPDAGIGWNLVGHPFEGPVDAADLRLVTRAPGSDCHDAGCALDEAPAELVGSARLWAYDPDAAGYVDLADDVVEPWVGFWSRLEADARQELPVLLHPDPFCT